MKICHVCGAECADSYEFCSLCGAQLSEEVKKEDTIDIKAVSNLVIAVSVEDVVTAEIYKDILSDNGIPFYSDNENSMKITFGGGFISEDIYVDEADLELAKGLYENLKNTEFEDFTDDFYEEEV